MQFLTKTHIQSKPTTNIKKMFNLFSITSTRRKKILDKQYALFFIKRKRKYLLKHISL